jgi:tRNA pseudouridine55 synthase
MDGVLVIDKPRGITSHDVVAAARRVLRESRIGHTGTLDPLATGILPLAIGRATRLVRFLTASEKDYLATIRFGVTTDSYDVTGSEVSRTDRQPTRDAVDAALPSLRGEYLQMPPAYSAKKVAGRRAYDLARQGVAAELTPSPVRVSRAEIVEFSGATAVVALTCSAGFYVRSFAHSLGGLVGTGACLEALRRTRSGEFELGQAITVEQLPGRADALVRMDDLLAWLPAVCVTDEGRRRVTHGREIDALHVQRAGRLVNARAAAGASRAGAAMAAHAVRADDGSSSSGTHVEPPGEWIRVVDEDGHLLALATPGSRPAALHPSVVLI